MRESPVEIVTRINTSIDARLATLTEKDGEEGQEQKQRLEKMKSDAARFLANTTLNDEQKRTALVVIEKNVITVLQPAAAVSAPPTLKEQLTTALGFTNLSVEQRASLKRLQTALAGATNAEAEQRIADEFNAVMGSYFGRGSVPPPHSRKLMEDHQIHEMKKYNLIVGTLCIIGAAVALALVLKVILPALTAVLSTLAVAGVGTGLAIGLVLLAVYGFKLCYRGFSGADSSAGAKPVGQNRNESVLASSDPLASTTRPGITSGGVLPRPPVSSRPESPIPAAAASASSGDGVPSPRAGAGAGAGAAGETAQGMSTSGSQPIGDGQAHEPSSAVVPPVRGSHGS